VTKNEFNILVTNVSAIASQTFSIQCGEFATAIAEDQAKELANKSFDQNQYLQKIDFQQILDSGYNSLDSLTAQLDQAREIIDFDQLAILLKQLPADLPDISKIINGFQLRQWVQHALQLQNDGEFYALHSYLMSHFGLGGDEIDDIIREAIAFDELGVLQDYGSKIASSHIKVDDLVTAASIQSMKVFEWLVTRASLSDNQVGSLFENLLSDRKLFQDSYKIVVKTKSQYAEILRRAESSSDAEIIAFLNRNKID
jgi:hypothetical protein